MATIPSVINGVKVEFSTLVVNDVDQKIVDALRFCIKKDIAFGHILDKIYISSANDQHTMPSRHAQMKAVDISRINGIKIVVGYAGSEEVKAIVEAIQRKFDRFVDRRENFGPFIKTKLGKPFSISGHKDHIHISVN